MKSDNESRKLRHLGLIGPRIPCKTDSCPFFAVKAGSCTNCYAKARRKLAHVKEMERKNKERYLSKPGIKDNLTTKKRERNRRIGYYQSAAYKAKKKAYYTSQHGRALYAARTAQRRTRLTKATPKGLSKLQLDQIKALYRSAQDHETITGIRHHVDHIIPLNSPVVCGLHVPWNLRVVAAVENIIKSNRLEEVVCV